MRRWTLILLIATAMLPLAAQPEEDVAAKGVARLSVMNGQVSVRRGDAGELIAAAVNAPLVVTDRLLTGPASRAELQFDSANMLRVGANAEIRLGQLDARRYQIQIALGTTTFRVLRSSNAEIEISTPSVSVRPLAVGVYRVTVHEDGSSTITVRAGQAEVFSPRGSERLMAAKTMDARGSASDPEFQVTEAIPYDGWDRWNDERDQMLERSQSYRYVSPEIYGAEDLDGHGHWVADESYGAVWAPTVAPGWAPYQQGRWVWEDYYGWTWVSYDPWGWAPYHYGRWYQSPRYGWCWWPGGFHEHHYWRPALVAFFGFGGGGIGFGFGNIGWVPLGPHEVFHPWYGRGFYGGRTVINNTVINNVNIAGTYRNARVANGVTAMRSEAFGRQGTGGGNLVRVDSTHLQNAGLVRGVVPVTPGRESLRVSDRNAQVSGFSRSVENRTFFSTRGSTTGSTRGTSFEQQRQAVERVTQRTYSSGSNLSGSGWRQVGPGGSGSSASAPTVRSGVAQREGGWQRFGDAGSQAGASGSTSGYRTPAMERQSPSQSYPPQYGASQGGRSYSSYGGTSGGSQAVRISPPIVRDRPASSGGGGGSQRSSAPAPRSSGGGSAPARSGGGESSHGGGGHHGR